MYIQHTYIYTCTYIYIYICIYIFILRSSNSFTLNDGMARVAHQYGLKLDNL